jgi:mannose-6-phosphate isomerase-like protein (cupin superfamily)
MKEEIRPWGSYIVLSDEPDHKVKRIVISPGKRLSLQKHSKRTEHWFVVRGNALVTLGEINVTVATGGSADIPQSSLHRIENTGAEDIVLIEIQTGTYFGEDDIERYDDDFGRV